MLTDQTLPCVDCKAEFNFTAGEMAFYQEKGLSIPKRCKPCRANKKQTWGQNHPGTRNQQRPQAPAPREEYPQAGDPTALGMGADNF